MFGMLVYQLLAGVLAAEEEMAGKQALGVWKTLGEEVLGNYDFPTARAILQVLSINILNSNYTTLSLSFLGQ
jgi:hypothetical protein